MTSDYFDQRVIHRGFVPIFFAALVALLLAASGVLAQAAPARAATTFTVGDFAYVTNDTTPDTVTVTGFAPGVQATAVTIGATVTNGADTYPITAIKDGAFSNVYSPTPGPIQVLDLSNASNLTTIGNSSFMNQQLTQLTIPNSVTAIGDGAFFKNLLTQLTIPNSVTRIGRATFMSNELTQIVIPNSVTSIGESAFSINKLAQLTIPNSVTTIERAAFQFNELTQVTIPDSVTDIAELAFSTNQLTQVTIPSGITTIKAGAFQANKITQLVIPEGITAVEHSAFAWNELTDLTIPASLTSIGTNAFASNQFTALTIPGTVTTVGDGAFHYNEKLTQLTIENGVTSIGELAFYRAKFVGVTIPASVTEIGSNAFYGNSKLVSMVFLGDPPSTLTPPGGILPGSGSLGDSAKVVVYYPKAYGPEGSGAFTAGSWFGYASKQFPGLEYDANAQNVSGTMSMHDPAAAPSLFTASGPEWGAQAEQRGFIRPGYTFTGWNTQADGSGDTYQAGDSLTLRGTGMTLYAQWQKANTTTPGGEKKPGGGVTTPGGGVPAPGSKDNTPRGVVAATGATGVLPFVGAGALLVAGAGALFALRRSSRNSQ